MRANGCNNSLLCWPNNVGSCCLCLHVAKSLTGFKLWATELPTTRNNMQEGVQMDTTDNIQQCCVHLRGLTLYYVVNSKTRRDESKQVSFHQFQRAVLLDVKYIWNNSFLNSGCRWKWRMIIAVNLPIQAIEEKKPEKKSGLSGFFFPIA